MKSLMFIIVFSKLLILSAGAVNAQETSASLSAMKDSFQGYLSNPENGVGTDTGNQSLRPAADPVAANASIATQLLLSRMTQQVLAKLNASRVRVVTSEVSKKEKSNTSSEQKSKR